MKIIFKDISRLLETVDDLMEKNGWNPAWKTQKNLCLLQTSTSLKKPHQWMPSEIFRFYKKNDGYKLSFVSILLDDDIDEWYTILEPLIKALMTRNLSKDIDSDIAREVTKFRIGCMMLHWSLNTTGNLLRNYWAKEMWTEREGPIRTIAKSLYFDVKREAGDVGFKRSSD